MSDKRAVVLNCIDGRIQVPVIEWIKKNYGVDNVDNVTEPGMDGILSDPQKSIEAFIKKVEISIRVNSAEIIVVVGHHDCRGNPVSEELHKEQIRSSVSRMKKEFSTIPVVGLWINDRWQGEKI